MHKIVHIVSDMNFGGVGRHLVLLDQHIKDNKETFYVIMPKGSILKESFKNMKVIEVAGIGDKSFSVEGVFAIIKVLKKYKPDIVHTHGALSGRIASRWLKIPTVFTKHTLSSPASGIKGKLSVFVQKVLKSKAIAVSKGAYNNLLDQGYDKADIALIYNGVGGVLHNPDEKIDNTILLVGRLEPIKGPFECLKIVSLLKKQLTQPFQMVFAGDGSLLNELKEKAIEEKLPVTFLGHVLDVDPWYEKAHVVINTSESEALPYSMIEAMSHEKPVVAFDISGIDEVVIDKETGFIIPNLNHQMFADKIQDLLESESLCKVMGKASRLRVDEMFSIEQMVDQLMKVYEGMYESYK